MIATGQPAVITCPIIGGFASNNPNHPKTLGDIVRHGIDAVRAGAAALHIHARDAEGDVTQDAAVYAEIGAAIRAEVLKGAPGAIEIGDRRAAIAHAIGLAGPQDIVLVAGKGHEGGQIVGDLVLPFDDVVVARECAA